MQLQEMKGIKQTKQHTLCISDTTLPAFQSIRQLCNIKKMRNTDDFSINTMSFCRHVSCLHSLADANDFCSLSQLEADSTVFTAHGSVPGHSEHGLSVNQESISAFFCPQQPLLRHFLTAANNPLSTCRRAKSFLMNKKETKEETLAFISKPQPRLKCVTLCKRSGCRRIF